MLPGERELMVRFHVSRLTVRAVLAHLADEGVLYRVQGAGTFVADANSITKSLHLTSFSEDIRSRNMRPGSKLIEAKQVAASSEIARDLELSPGAPVLFVERVRLADGIPICIERSYIPAWLGLSVQHIAHAKSLYTLLTERGAQPDHAEQTISASVVTTADAVHLDVAPHTAALVVARLLCDARGRKVETSTGIYRWDRYQFNITVKRKK